MFLVSKANSSPLAILSAPTVVDASKTPDSTFSVDIAIADVDGLFGWNFFVYYNTSVLTATNLDSYAPFTAKAYAVINDTGGWAYFAYTMEFGEKAGFSTLEPKPIAKIDFTVDAFGTSVLDIQRPTLSHIKVYAIDNEVNDGFFANVAVELHDIAVTAVTVSRTQVEVDGNVTITVTVANQGDFTETFNVSAYCNATLIQTQTGITLEPGTNTQRTFTWIANVAKGIYTIRAVVSSLPGETDTGDNTRVAADRVRVGSNGGGIPFIYYVAAGIAIIIVIAILVFALRRRKPKPT